MLDFPKMAAGEQSLLSTPAISLFGAMAIQELSALARQASIHIVLRYKHR